MLSTYTEENVQFVQSFKYLSIDVPAQINGMYALNFHLKLVGKVIISWKSMQPK